jgi:hypothetical protein
MKVLIDTAMLLILILSASCDFKINDVTTVVVPGIHPVTELCQNVEIYESKKIILSGFINYHYEEGVTIINNKDDAENLLSDEINISTGLKKPNNRFFHRIQLKFDYKNVILDKIKGSYGQVEGVFRKRTGPPPCGYIDVTVLIIGKNRVVGN